MAIDLSQATAVIALIFRRLDASVEFPADDE
jgi:hypothetical protein